MTLHWIGLALQIAVQSAPPVEMGSDSLRLTIEVRTTTASQGHADVLRVILWNNLRSAVAVLAPLNWPNERIMLEITGPDGKLVEAYNFVFPNEVPVGPGADFAVRIPPHSFVGRDILLCPGPESGKPGYDLSRPGRYHAKLALDVYPTGGGRGMSLRSNDLSWSVEKDN